MSNMVWLCLMIVSLSCLSLSTQRTEQRMRADSLQVIVDSLTLHIEVSTPPMDSEAFGLRCYYLPKKETENDGETS